MHPHSVIWLRLLEKWSSLFVLINCLMNHPFIYLFTPNTHLLITSEYMSHFIWQFPSNQLLKRCTAFLPLCTHSIVCTLNVCRLSQTEKQKKAINIQMLINCQHLILHVISNSTWLWCLNSIVISDDMHISGRLQEYHCYVFYHKVAIFRNRIKLDIFQ